MSNGTPKNLSGAIVNALNEVWPKWMHEGSTFTEDSYEVQTILKHVRDRIAQDISTMAMIEPQKNETPMFRLWSRLFPESDLKIRDWFSDFKKADLANTEMKEAIEDFCTVDFSDDYQSAIARAKEKLRTCYLRYCLSAEKRKQIGWLLPEDK